MSEKLAEYVTDQKADPWLEGNQPPQREPITKENIWEIFDFCAGQDIMLHSSYKAFGGVVGGPGTVVDAFSELCHTVLFPNFNFQSWTETHYWDYAETPSKMGIITEIARERFPRTLHPVYPFAVSSPDVAEWQACQDTEAFGHGSPFAKMFHEGGMIVSIGLTDFATQTFTPVHFAEYLVGIDYRYTKHFSGIYKGQHESPAIKEFSIQARCRGVVNDPNPASHELIDKGVIHVENQGDMLGIWPVYWADYNEYIEAMQWYAKNEPHKLHKHR